jgi:hypothetical protein
MMKLERDDGRFYYIYISKDMIDDNVLFVLRGGRNVSILHRVCTGSMATLLGVREKLYKRRLRNRYNIVQ